MVPTLLMVPLTVRRTLTRNACSPVRSPATRTTCGEFGPGSFRACGECRMKVLPCLIFTLSNRSPS